MTFEKENFINKPEKSYPKNETELAIELLSITSEFTLLLRKKAMKERNKEIADILKELEENVISIATEINMLFKNPEKKVRWPSGEKDWKQALDFLRETLLETKSEFYKDNEKGDEVIKELEISKEERNDLFKQKINDLRNKPLGNVLGINIFAITKELEDDFFDAQDENDVDKESSVWKALNGFLKMDIDSLEKIDTLIENIKKDFEDVS